MNWRFFLDHAHTTAMTLIAVTLGLQFGGGEVSKSLVLMTTLNTLIVLLPHTWPQYHDGEPFVTAVARWVNAAKSLYARYIGGFGH